ncbi:protein-lysine N-methyltransferase EEF2KMT [Marchantia polymorpha subsp. ruderalis]|uniref:FAM86 N-terminal domain-containing protein n=2 Tax=Marchantia polymorpha TaxID=3197 RepID=A0AAF6AQ75_MARPO|nr:hypothetical protein MARPO_0153s0022 [Marchantia polymorpha]BBM98595.1 hypothetical protein Mp_1g14680 [Marchantia polymorpha subsp. ruderalis]|eukprot:PTQ28855.1 hypothetical protein MARPO_0153s0022 [Marchantia polymorpha]
MGRQDVTTEELLAGAFLSMQPASTLISLARDVGGGIISGYAQQTLLIKCFRNEVYMRYPASKAYVRNVLKNIILTAEQEGQEVLDDLYDMHSILFQTEKQLAERCYKTITFMIPDETISNLTCTLGDEGMLKAVERKLVTLRVSLNMLDGDTGYSIWPAGLFLSEFFLYYPELVKGYSCLELGSGTGICGVWLSRLSCSKLVLTDGSLSTLVNLRHNLSINGILQPSGENFHTTQDVNNPSNVECRQLLWETATQEELDSFNAEVIIGADLIYDPTPLVPILAGLLRPKRNSKGSSNCSQVTQDELTINSSTENGEVGKVLPEKSKGDGNGLIYPVAYLAQAIRNVTTLELFISMVSRAGLELIDVTDTMKPPKCLPDLDGFDRSQIRIHKVFYPSS